MAPRVKSENVAEFAVPDDVRPITKSDSTVYSPPLRMLRSVGAGVIQVETLGGTRLWNFGAGETRYGKVKQVYNTNTTVSGAIEGGE